LKNKIFRHQLATAKHVALLELTNNTIIVLAVFRIAFSVGYFKARLCTAKRYNNPLTKCKRRLAFITRVDNIEKGPGNPM